MIPSPFRRCRADPCWPALALRCYPRCATPRVNRARRPVRSLPRVVDRLLPRSPPRFAVNGFRLRRSDTRRGHSVRRKKKQLSVLKMDVILRFPDLCLNGVVSVSFGVSLKFHTRNPGAGWRCIPPAPQLCSISPFVTVTLVLGIVAGLPLLYGRATGGSVVAHPMPPPTRRRRGGGESLPTRWTRALLAEAPTAAKPRSGIGYSMGHTALCDAEAMFAPLRLGQP
jgi:hypothetical protein